MRVVGLVMDREYQQMLVVNEGAKKPASDLDGVTRTPIYLPNGPIMYFGLGPIESSECIA